MWKPRPSPCYGDVIGVQGSSESGRGGDDQKKKDGIYNFWDLMGFNGILNGIGILPTSIFLLGGVLLSLLNPLISIDYYSVWNMNDFPFSWE